MKLSFEGVLFEWRGPAPYYFVEIDPEVSQAIKQLARELSYGWGVIRVEAKLNEISWSTALIPKGETYYLPIRDSIRKPNQLVVGNQITIELSI